MGNVADSQHNIDNLMVSKGDVRNKEFWTKRLEEYKEKVKNEPDKSRLRIQLALAYRKLKEYPEAISILTKIVEKEPKNMSVLIDRGITYNMMRKYSNAIKDFNGVIKLDKTHLPAYYNRAATYFLQKKFKESEKDYSRVLLKSPKPKNEKEQHKLAQVYVRRGELYEKWKKLEKAVDDYEKAMDLDENLETTIGQRCENILVRLS